MDIEEVFRDLPDGAFFVTGKLLKQFAAAVAADRARLFQGCGDEIATPQGRFFNIATGSGGVSSEGPWSILPGSDPEKVRVSKSSAILRSINVTSEITVEGINSEFAIGVGDVLYLRITLDSTYLVESITLVGGSRWDGYPSSFRAIGSGSLGDPVTINEGRYLIGYGLDPADVRASSFDGPVVNGVKVVRCCFGPLRMERFDTGFGEIAHFPNPPHLPGPP